MATPVGDSYSVASGQAINAGWFPTAATALSVTDYADLTHFQRDQTGLGKAINIGYTCAGNPTRIDWRAVDYYTGAPITSWATLVNYPAASGTVPVFMPASRWARIQLRDSVNTALTATTTSRMSVGVKWLMIGQSNMFNRVASGSLSPTGDPQAICYTRTPAVKRVGNLNDSIAANSTTSAAGYGTGLTLQTDVRGDGFVYFANLLSQGLGMTVMIIERAVGGSDIDDWMDNVSNNHWDALVTAVSAMGGDVEGATWLQGETNANTMTRSTRLARLASLHGQLHSLTGRSTSTFKFAITTIGTGPFSGSSEGEFGVMREADNWYARNTAGAILGTSAHDTATGSDNVHINAEGHSRVGRREAKSVLAAYGIGSSAAGPRITGATRSGTAVTVSIAHTSGTALADGAGGAGTALTGFRFFDAGAAGAQIAVSSTAISGNTLQLVLATEPVGALTMDYAMTNVPHGVATSSNSFVPASCVYDNALYHASTVGCPLQPCAAFTVS